MVVLLDEGGAGDGPQAGVASYTLVLVDGTHLLLQTLLLLEKERAGAFAYDHGDTVEVHGLLHDLDAGKDVVRVDGPDELDAESPDDAFDIHGIGVYPAEMPSRTGIGLVTRHGGGPVVEDDHDDAVAVEQGGCEGLHPRMEERGVADECDGLLVGRLCETACCACAPSHTYDEIRRPERGLHP